MLDNINIHRVLIAPLDWGLGHATRCIPLIRAFQFLGYEVVIAAEGAPAALLSAEFPGLTILPLKGYHIQYAKTGKGLLWRMLLQVPKILRSIREEHHWLQHTIAAHQIDLVISDNRYGLYTDLAPCIFITHQLTIKAPLAFAEAVLRKINYHYINRFTACWVPDAEGSPNLGALLSHPAVMPAIPVHWLGLLTRFVPADAPIRYQYCFLLSGPEPQRSLLEEKILADLPKVAGRVLLVRGKPSSSEKLTVPENTTVFNHLASADLQQAIAASELVICRSGYTSLMELVRMQKKAMLIPTPGQTEQEYLARELSAGKIFYSSSQADLSLLKDLEAAKKFDAIFPGIPIFETNVLEALLRAL